MSRYVLKNGIATVTVLNPPVNGLSKTVRSALLASVQQARLDGAKAMLVVGSDPTFPAGADISEFATGKWRDDPDLNEVIREFDRTQIPIVAAIHGTALGGGMEVALSCHYRVASKTAKMGLPEVHLGILPGAGGTQRLPRVVGVETAIEMIASGKPISALDAKNLGLVDDVIDGKSTEELIESAIKFIEEKVLTSSDLLPRISERVTAPVDVAVYDTAKSSFAKKMRGQLAPQKIVDAVRAAAESETFEEGMQREAKLFEDLMAGNQAKALQYMFFAERECSKVPGVDAKLAKDIKHVGVIGGGTMGRGIAMCFMNKGIPVTLAETTPQALEAGLKGIESLYRKSSAFRSGRMSEDALQAKMGLVKGSVDAYADMKECDAVIEAVFESMDLKKDIFSNLGKVCKDETLLCSNTSYLDVDIIGESSGRPEMFLGTHFFSPANIMPLLENVRGTKTSPAAIATAMKMGKTIGKTAVLAGNCFGFIGNRMFEPYVQQAISLLEEGASPSQIDRVLYNYGFAMGPLAVLDLAGNDVPYRIRREPYYPHTPDNVGGRRGATWMMLADALCDMGRLGQKTGAGWYTYDGRKAVEDEVVHRLCEEHRGKFNIQKRSDISDEEILQRCLFPLVNEGTRILEERIASRPSDIDVVWAAGYGAPRYNPPMFFADRVVGLKNVRDALSNYHEKFPELPHWQFQPSNLLQELAESGKSLADFSKRQ